jgi:pantoate--beta-alanine ligase
MSSRNMRLSAEARNKAPTIPAALQFVKDNLQPGNLLPLILQARSMLTAQKMKVDYFEIADADTLEPVNNWDGEQSLVVLAAAFLGEVRLIDNMTLY